MPLKTHRDELPYINMTPMVDILLVLIIFFMLASKFSEVDRKITVRVPEVAGAGALTPAPEKRVVHVDRDGNITLDNRAATLEQLTNRLAAARSQNRDLGVLVRGDGAGRVQRLAEVLTACRQAGVAEMAISVRPAKTLK
ncbi:MAG: biopolymer transporter ExbD [Pirellulales bacterium]